MDRAYVDTVRLLLQVAPEVFAVPCFAMKGGTALNLFVEEMPRLSVDIDVVYRDHTVERSVALAEIGEGLRNIAERLARVGLRSEIRETQTRDETKLFIHREPTQVKVEVNHVFRGTVLPVTEQRLSKTARDLFTTDICLPMLQPAELYGSKIVAALDRQHPRDFFDVHRMFEHTGLSPAAVECFVAYLAGHNRPVHEVLFSRDQDMTPAYEDEFRGMTYKEVSLEELIATRARLRDELPFALTDAHRQFLLSLVTAEPQWDLMECPHLNELPALRWKLQNLEALRKKNPKKFRQQHDELLVRFEA